MVNPFIPWIAVFVVASTGTGLLLTRDWRWNLGLLGLQYLGAATLSAQYWPLGMAAAKLVAGWMTTAALGMTLTTLQHSDESGERSWPQGRAFRLFLAGIVFVLAVAITPRIGNVVAGVEAPVIAGTILMTGTGLLLLGTSAQMPRVVFGLLAVLMGFETFYATVEGSILVAGLLVVVTLGLGLVGAYLLSASPQEETP